MKHIAFIDFGIKSVPYKNVNIETDFDAKTVEKILNAVSDRFKIIVRQCKKNIDSNNRFYSLEEAINIIKYSKLIYTSIDTEPTETYEKFEDGIAYHLTLNYKVHVRKHTIPNTKK